MSIYVINDYHNSNWGCAASTSLRAGHAPGTCRQEKFSFWVSGWYNSVDLFAGKDIGSLVGKVIFSTRNYIVVLLPPEDSRKQKIKEPLCKS